MVVKWSLDGRWRVDDFVVFDLRQGEMAGRHLASGDGFLIIHRGEN